MKKTTLCSILLLTGLFSTTGSAAYKESLSTSAGSHLSESAKEDLGDLREVNVERFKPTYRARFSTNGSFTTNARLEGSHSSSDFLFQPTLEAGVNIPLGAGFDLDLVGRVESVTYAARSSRNFFGASGAATFSYTHSGKVPRIYIGAEPYWYGGLDAERISSAVALTAGTDHSIVFNRGRTVGFGGYQFYRYFAAPSRDDRDAHQVLAGVTHQLRSNMFGQVFYSVRYENFHDRDYSNFRHAGGVSLLYQFSQNLFGNLTGTYIHQNASTDIHSYSSAGLTLGLTWQF